MAPLTITRLDVHLQNASVPCIRIGRAPGDENKLLYKDRKVSRRHCRIGIRDDGWCGIFDEGGKTGTYLNGVRISRSIHGFRIARGDRITLGNPRKRHHLIRINSIRISERFEPRVEKFEQIANQSF